MQTRTGAARRSAEQEQDGSAATAAGEIDVADRPRTGRPDTTSDGPAATGRTPGVGCLVGCMALPGPAHSQPTAIQENPPIRRTHVRFFRLPVLLVLLPPLPPQLRHTSWRACFVVGSLPQTTTPPLPLSPLPFQGPPCIQLAPAALCQCSTPAPGRPLSKPPPSSPWPPASPCPSIAVVAVR